jgi:hypothetical protein
MSGNVEHRYRCGHLSLRIDEGFLRGGAPIDDSLEALDALRNRHHEDLFAALRADLLHAARQGTDDRTKPTLISLRATLSTAQVREFTSRLATLAEEFSAEPSDRQGIPIGIVIGHYSGARSPEPDGGSKDGTVTITNRDRSRHHSSARDSAARK